MKPLLPEWTRDCDRFIATKILGLKLMGEDRHHVEHLERGGDNGWHDRVLLPYYNADIEHAFHPARKFMRGHKNNKIEFSSLRPDGSIDCTLKSGGISCLSEGVCEADALARALFIAYGGRYSED